MIPFHNYYLKLIIIIIAFFLLKAKRFKNFKPKSSAGRVVSSKSKLFGLVPDLN